MENKILAIMKRNLFSCNALSTYERSVFEKVLKCRTEAVAHLHYCCDKCGKRHQVFKSCRSRMCPVCRGAETVRWTAKREAELLPVSYFLLTFTIPKELRILFLYNKQLCYNLMFKASGRTVLKGVETSKRYFNGRAGFFSVLHTHDQRLNHHPHIHVVVPSGALSHDSTAWNHSHPAFFLPVRKLSAVFRDKLLFCLRKAVKEIGFVIPKTITDINQTLKSLETIPWVVHSQAPSKKKSIPAFMIRYLSRYVNRAPASEDRITRCENGKVYMRYFDRKRNKPKTEIISEKLFLQRLALHILPRGFKKVRFYGFMANRCRKSLLALCRMLLGQPLAVQQETDDTLNDAAFLFWKYFGIDITLCPECGKGHLVLKAKYPAGSG